MKKLGVICCGCLILVLAQMVTGKGQRQEQDLPRPHTLDLPEFVADYFDPMPVPADTPLTKEGIELGRRLFYDKGLSVNHTISCGSCHRQEFGFSDHVAFSKGVGDSLGVLNAMPLVNLGWARHLFWDGRSASLEEQISDPITNKLEMANTWEAVLAYTRSHEQYPTLFKQVFGTDSIHKTHIMKAIAQFERSLASFNTRFDRYYFEGAADALTQKEERGLDIFFGYGNCNHCHSDVLLTDNFFRNNGLDLSPQPGLWKTTGLETDRGRMKVPTLRNIALTAPYMHDGRFATLEEVLDFYNTGIHQKSPNIDEHMVPMGRGLFLTPDQKSDLIAFLHTLTDSSFISNPAFRDPNP
jgi:cytochrome c peroxidase